MKLIRVVYNLGEYRLLALCSYQDVRRVIKFTWKEKVMKDLPPKNWPETVRSEIEDVFNKTKRGGGLPF